MALTAQQIINLIGQEKNLGGYSTVVENAETGQTSQVLNDLGGFNATYKPPVIEQTEQGITYTSPPELSGFSRVDPTNNDYIQYFDTGGNLVGQEKILSSGQQIWSDLGPIITAIAGQYVAQALGGVGGSPAAGNGAFLGENVVSGIPSFDAAFSNAGGAFNSAFGLPIGNGAFLGEGVPTGINAWDTAYTNAGGVFNPAFALGPDGLVGTPLVTPPVVTPPVVTPPVVTPPVVTPPPVVPPAVTPPVVTPPVVTPPFVPPTITEVLRTIAPIATVATLVNAVSPKTTTPTTPTGFDIVPIPTDWKTPNKPTTAPFTALSPINFGTQNLLKGTQFERFLDPNYGQVPEPVQYSQPSNLSYNDLMSILGSKQGMPSASSLSINDIISGIQNQYGQVPTRTMG
jgi:hypothetical protein